MRQKSNSTPASSETLVRNIRRATRKHHAAEEKGSIKSPENHLALRLSADSMSLIRQKAGYGCDTRIYARSAC